MRKIDFNYPGDKARELIENFAESHHYPFEKRIFNDGRLLKYILTTENKEDTVLNVYFKGDGSSSSLMLEKGDGAFIENLLGYVSKGSDIKSRIGIDEAGKGDYFGPLVIAAAGVSPENEVKLKSIGVADSKILADKNVIGIANSIKKICPNNIVVIGPQKYNELYDKIGNLNNLLAWGHARALENILKHDNFKTAISDKFTSKDTLKKTLMDKGRKIELIERHRAESDTAVAAASILARAEFIKRLDILSIQLGLQLPKGCSEKVLSAGRDLVKKFGKEKLGEYAKLHFKTTVKILS